MKLVTTMIKPAQLDELHQELERVGISGMTVTEVRSLGQRRAPGEIWRGVEYAVELLPRYKVEVVVDDPLAEPVVEAIERIAGGGRRDGGATSRSRSARWCGSGRARPISTPFEGGMAMRKGPIAGGRSRLRRGARMARALAAGVAAVAASVPVALAQEAESTLVEEAEVALNSGDTAWMLTSTVLVLMMTIPGLAMFYAGMVRKKNVLAMSMQVFATCCLATLVWMVLGYSLAFGGEGALIGGFSRLFLGGMNVDSLTGTIPESVFMTFQMTFAIITPALISGAFADRMKFSAMLWFMGLWGIVVYAPIAHWVWGAGGWIGGLGALDFAGGTVVHINCGIAGLVAALVLGPRLGYGSENMAPHNLTLSVIGASLLWVGWFGFNAGSALAANGTAGMAMAVTQIATAAAALAWMLVEWLRLGKPSVLGILSGAVAGLVAITPAAGFVAPVGALIIGVVAGIVCYWAATSLKHMLGYDDALDAFGIHGVGGIVGALLTGVLAVEAIGGAAGVLEGNPGQFMAQVYGVLATIIWCGLASFVLLKVIDLTVGLRVSQEIERDSLDLQLHGETVQ